MALLQPKKSLSITTALLVAFTFIKVSAEESDNETPESPKKEILETIKKIGSDNFKIREWFRKFCIEIDILISCPA